MAFNQALKSTAQIMADLGFNAESSPSAKTAFLRHLMKCSYGVDVRPPLKLEKSTSCTASSSAAPNSDAQPTKQLSFNFSYDLQTG